MSRWVDYDGAQHHGYVQGRALTGTAAGTWRDALTARLPVPAHRLIDLGSGTGRFTGLLGALAGVVVGIEPAAAMRTGAAALRPGASYVGGRAEALPVADGAADAVVMFFVLHHVEDLDAAGREIARVLRPGGRLIVVGSFAGRLHPRVYHHYMPGSRAVEEGMFPPLARVRAAADAAGLGLLALDEVGIEVADGLGAYHRRLSHRAVSPLARLDDAEVTAGLDALARDVGGPADTGPVRHTHDLTTFVRPP